MTKNEAARAIKNASRIFAYVPIIENSPRAFRLSKSSAMKMLKAIPDDAAIRAWWIDDETKILAIG